MLNRDNRPGGIARRPQTDLVRPGGSQLLSRWDPWSDMDDMHRQMDSLFNRFFGYTAPTSGAGWAAERGQNEPDVDVYENDQEYTIVAALPGVDQDDIHLEATTDSISLRAEHRAPWRGHQQHWSGQTGGEGQAWQNTETGGRSTEAGGRGHTAVPPSSRAANQGQPSNTGYQGKPGSTQYQQGPGSQPYDNQRTGDNWQRPDTQHRQSRYSQQGFFEFTYTLPEEIKPDQICAHFKNGRLEIHLPKDQPARGGSRAIPIQIDSSDHRVDTERQGAQSGAAPGTQQVEHQPREEGAASRTPESPASAPAAAPADRTRKS